MGPELELLTEEDKAKDELTRELSVAIGNVLKQRGIEGDYIFSVRKDSDYDMNPATTLNGKKLSEPMHSLGCGYASVEKPGDVRPI